MRTFIQNLLSRVDAKPDEIIWLPADRNMGDLILANERLAIESTMETVSSRLRSLSITKTHLESEIARQMEELRQVDIAIIAMRAAAEVLEPTGTVNLVAV